MKEKLEEHTQFGRSTPKTCILTVDSNLFSHEIFAFLKNNLTLVFRFDLDYFMLSRRTKLKTKLRLSQLETNLPVKSWPFFVKNKYVSFQITETEKQLFLC